MDIQTKSAQDPTHGRLSKLALAGLLAVAAGFGARTAAAEPSGSGTVDTLEEANKHFITQWGPTLYNADGAPYGYNDCGPAAVVMTLSALGIIQHLEPDAAATTIDAVRDAALGYDSDYSDLMGWGNLTRALEAFGSKGELLSSLALGSVDEALERGNPLIIGGYPWEIWGEAQRAKGNYLNGKDPGGHFIVVLGKTERGRYIIGDPLVIDGTMEVASWQLSEFISSQGFGVLEVIRAADSEDSRI